MKSFSLRMCLYGVMLPVFMWSLVQALVYQVDRFSVDRLTFSNTQTWSEELLQERALVPRFVASLPHLESPAENTSPVTEKEIAELHSLVPERTFEKVFEIKREIDMPGQQYNDVPMIDLVTSEEKPLTSLLLKQTHAELRGHILREKAYHDRVRPSHLDPSLTTAIAVPAHPSYPSGHAAESRFIARLLSELDEANEAAYLASAARIAYNREVAGVHYASDTKAGMLYGDWYFDALLQSEEFQVLLRGAQVEWK